MPHGSRGQRRACFLVVCAPPAPRIRFPVVCVPPGFVSRSSARPREGPEHPSPYGGRKRPTTPWSQQPATLGVRGSVGRFMCISNGARATSPSGRRERLPMAGPPTPSASASASVGLPSGRTRGPRDPRRWPRTQRRRPRGRTLWAEGSPPEPAAAVSAARGTGSPGLRAGPLSTATRTRAASQRQCGCWVDTRQSFLSLVQKTHQWHLFETRGLTQWVQVGHETVHLR